MQLAKKRLEISIVGLFVFPSSFIIICGLLSIKYAFMFRYIDLMIVIFVSLLLFFLILTFFAYRAFEKASIAELQMQEDEYLEEESRMSVNEVEVVEEVIEATPEIHQDSIAKEVKIEEADEETKEEVKETVSENRKEALKEAEKQESTEEMMAESKEIEPIVNLVGEGSIFRGDIETQDDVLIQGTIIGSITTEKDVFVDGVVEGDIKCRFLALNEAKVIGNITCKDHVTMDEKTVIQGDITADEIIVPGCIEGALFASKHVQLFNSSIIYGDINCSNVDFAHGAVIRGKVSIS